MAQRMPGLRGTSTRRMSSSLRQPRGMQRAGAAEGHQRVVARIMAALDRDDADRRAMLAVTTEMMPCAVSIEVEAEPLGQPRPIASCARSPRRSACGRPADGSGSATCSTTLASVTVGSVVAAAVADRAGIGAGAVRARPSAARRNR